MSLLSVGGLSTGIDTKTLLDQLINAERESARIIERKKTAVQERLSAVRSMNQQMLGVRTALDPLREIETFLAKSATSSDAAALSATASASAVNGSMRLNVIQLAAAHQVASTYSATDPAATLADTSGPGDVPDGTVDGTITLKIASADDPVTINVTDFSLNGIASAINTAKAGVRAAVVNNGSGYRLLLTAEQSGLANRIESISGSNDLAAVLPGLGSMDQATAAANAQVRIGDPTTGMLVESATNSFSEAFPGLTIDVKKVQNGIDLTIDADTSAVGEQVKSLVGSFNAALNYYKSNSRYDTTTKTAGKLFQDYDIRRQIGRIEDALTRRDETLTEGFRSLSEIGITFTGDGTMKLDETVFKEKFAADATAVRDVFAKVGGEAEGILEGLVRPVDGSLTLRVAEMDESIQGMNSRISLLDARLERRRAYYSRQFQEMERITAQLQSQGSALSGIPR